MKNKYKLLSFFLFITCFLLCLTGCGSVSSSVSSQIDSESIPQLYSIKGDMYRPNYSVGDIVLDGISDLVSSGGLGSSSNISYDSSYVENSSGSLEVGESLETTESDEKMSYGATIEIETKDLVLSIKELKEMIDNSNGLISYSFVENADDITWDSTEYNSSFSRRNSEIQMKLKIPQENYKNFMELLKNNTEDSLFIYSSEEYQENLTSTYKDYELSLESLRIQEERLKEFMKSAENVEDMLNISDRLTTVQYEIEKIVNAMNSIDNRVSYADITIHVKEVIKYTDNSKNSSSFFTRFGGYIVGSVDNFLYNMEGFLEGIIYLLPNLLVFILVIYGIYKGIKILIRKHMKKKKSSLKPTPIMSSEEDINSVTNVENEIENKTEVVNVENTDNVTNTDVEK